LGVARNAWTAGRRVMESVMLSVVMVAFRGVGLRVRRGRGASAT
jgi:hypothetical protein